jgi:hypothetical protein
MTIIPSLIIATILYSVYGYMTYSPELKDKSFVLYLGLLCVLMANTVWIFLSKNTLEPTRLLQYGLYWDLIITGLTIALPIILFGARFSGLQTLGLLITIAGLLTMKFGST